MHASTSGLKYRFCEHSNNIGRVAFALDLGPYTNDSNIHTYRHFKTIFCLVQGSLKRIFPLTLNIDVLTITISTYSIGENVNSSPYRDDLSACLQHGGVVQVYRSRAIQVEKFLLWEKLCQTEDPQISLLQGRPSSWTLSSS